MAKITLTSAEIQARIDKAQAALDKACTTLAKHEAKKAKMETKMQAEGWNPDRKYDYTRSGVLANEDAYWFICDYEDVLDNIKNKKADIEKKRHSLEVAHRNYKRVQENEKVLDTVLPECMKDMMKELADEWTRNDIAKREAINAEYRQIERNQYGKPNREQWKSFIEKWTYNYSMILQTTDAEFAKSNEREARMWTLNLWNRIKEKVGNVTDWSGIYCNGVALNGWVKGDKGQTEIETITAGGYNIQRLHVRTILH